MTQDLNQARKKLADARAELDYYLEVFGDDLAKRYGYKNISGMDALHYHLIKTHNWLPRDVTTMTAEHLRLALSQELAGWTVPPEARG